LRALIAGGAGFIGSNFVRRVVDGTFKNIDSIVVLDKLTYAGSLENFTPKVLNEIEFVQGDICDIDIVQKSIKRCDVIINFAAESHVDRSIQSSSEFVKTNVLGTDSLLQTTLQNHIGTFVQVSTDEVYGSISNGSWDEDEPLLPNSPYSATKASADLVARSYFKTHGVDVRITRCSNNYGPYQYPEKVIPLFITNLLQEKKIPIYGDGGNVRDWLHVDDHCMGIYKALESGRPGEIYNIGGGRELRNIELARIILKMFGKDESFIDWVPDRLGHDLRYSVDFQKARNSIGYSPQIPFETGIKEVVDWYRESSNWWKPRKKLN
jgi:dTDP-glucose 4,6-dehydratase